jgi:uncharacterized membrane protein YbhN (UPF0104 family)
VKPPDAVKSRALSILVIVACLALGTLTVVRHTGDLWYYFAGVFYGIAVINITAEVLLSGRASRRRREVEQRKTQQDKLEDKDQSSPPE